MAVTKKRTPKTSKGIHGAGGKMPHLTGIQKVLLGQGLYRNINKTNFGKTAKPAPVK